MRRIISTSGWCWWISSRDRRRVVVDRQTELLYATIQSFHCSHGEIGWSCRIMYMMALQNLTSCPFRVVDEINQGMDAQNERRVFRQITQSSCGAKLPQYFLITPKLLPDLSYHPNMTLACIYNGAHQPDNKVLAQTQYSSRIFKFSLRRALDLHKKKMSEIVV